MIHNDIIFSDDIGDLGIIDHTHNTHFDFFVEFLEVIILGGPSPKNCSTRYSTMFGENFLFWSHRFASNYLFGNAFKKSVFMSNIPFLHQKNSWSLLSLTIPHFLALPRVGNTNFKAGGGITTFSRSVYSFWKH